MTETVDTIVIGAGVIGLAVARELAMHGHQVIVIERNARIGQETSSRNSEVIHAGIYYATDSLKARLCVAGKERLYAYCLDKDIPHERCGKVILAVREAQEPALADLRRRAMANGVNDLESLSAADLRALEPAVVGTAGLWSPSSGIIDSHALMLALEGDLENLGGSVAVQSEFREGRVEQGSIRLTVVSGDGGGGSGSGSGSGGSGGSGSGGSGGSGVSDGSDGSGGKVSSGEVSEIEARTVINAAGLSASRVARAFHGIEQPPIPDTRFAKGSYFLYDGATPFRHLVYPLPVDGGLGIHATHDLAGSLRFGPDVEWVDSIDYAVDGARRAQFVRAVKTWWPDLDAGRMTPGYAGVRPKLNSGRGTARGLSYPRSGPGPKPDNWCTCWGSSRRV